MSDNQADFLVQIQKEFLEEATHLLDQCEESYLKLEHPEHREQELATIFRLAHSIKGAGAAVGFTDLAEFAHVVEDCLSILRVNPNLITSEIISLLLRAGDAFKVRIDMLKRNSEDVWDVSALKTEIVELNRSLGNDKVPEVKVAHHPTPAPTAAPAAPVEEAAAPAEAAMPAAETHQAAETPAPKLSLVPPTHAEAPKPAAHAPASAPASGPKAPTAQTQAAGSSSVKVDTDRIESVLDLVGELVVIKSQLINETTSYAQNQKLISIVNLLDKTIRELQDKALGMRMTPLKALFLKAQRIARDLSLKLGKQVEFKTAGEETELDRTMVEMISDPMMHMIRNSLDHGVERPELRKARGKPEKGTITISGRQAGGRVILKIEDDGAGINRERVLKKAVERGLVPAGRDPNSLSDSEVFKMIFEPGFSTAEQVTDVSGRGVGMDVVKTNIEKLRGTIDISSVPEKGTVFMVSIPLTTSITDGMQVVIDDRYYIIPMDSIRELGEVTVSSITEVSNGHQVLNVRGRLLPVLPTDHLLAGLSEELKHATEAHVDQKRDGVMVVVEVGSKHYVLRINAVVGQTQVVLKPLGSSFEAISGIAGAAILGDGKVALVLDVDSLVKAVNTKPTEASEAAKKAS